MPISAPVGWNFNSGANYLEYQFGRQLPIKGINFESE